MLEKAYIEIEDNRKTKTDVQENTGQQSKLSLPGIGGLLNKANSLPNLKNISNLGSNMQKKKRYTVRFNPSSLSLSAYGGGNVSKTSFDEKNTNMSYADSNTTILLSVQLIFDDYNAGDCFMNEIVNPKDNIKKAANAVTGKRYSVQQQVEGFIAALRNRYTRRIQFCWGKLMYRGILNYVESEYTMFSIHGRPVRAVVNLSIMCSDEKVEDGNMGQWRECFEDAFLQDGANKENIGGKFGNLVNLNI